MNGYTYIDQKRNYLIVDLDISRFQQITYITIMHNKFPTSNLKTLLTIINILQRILYPFETTKAKSSFKKAML